MKGSRRRSRVVILTLRYLHGEQDGAYFNIRGGERLLDADSIRTPVARSLLAVTSAMPQRCGLTERHTSANGNIGRGLPQ